MDNLTSHMGGDAQGLGVMDAFTVVSIVIQDPEGRRVEMQLPSPLEIPEPFVVEGQLLAGSPADQLASSTLGQQKGGFLDFFGKLLTTAGGAFAADRAAKSAADVAEAQLKAAQAAAEAARLQAQAATERALVVESRDLIPGVPNAFTFVGGLGVVAGLVYLIFG